MKTGLVVGAGPAGLMAAEEMARAGLNVTVVDQMPSVGRKFLMAGKSGLNITKADHGPDFVNAYGPLPAAMRQTLASFGPTEVMAWAEGLGQPLFTGSTGRVFPKAMKASPLLRAWMGRLGELGVTLHTRWRWVGFAGDALKFQTPEGPQVATPDVTVLALGGASWRRLGSDGLWAGHLLPQVTPYKPANFGLAVEWSDHMAPHFGQPVKAVTLTVGNDVERGEFVVSKRGLEGGAIYAVSRAVREGAALTMDLVPQWTLDETRSRLIRKQGKDTLANHLRKVLRLDPVRMALLNEWGRPFPADIGRLIKALPVRHAGPRPMDEAISTAGGVRFDALTDGLMLRDRPGVFCAGEMLDWEAPTGGYLITGCLATGRAAGRAAVDYVASAR